MARFVLGLSLIALPVLELALLIKTGQAIGFWATLGLLVGAVAIGAIVMSRQGITVARRTREAMALGRPPVGPVLDGAFLLLAGALLITPGFLTDVLALLLLVPPVRRKVARWCVRSLVERAHVQVKMHEAQSQAHGPVRRPPPVARSKARSSRANSSAWARRRGRHSPARMSDRSHESGVAAQEARC